MAKQILQILKQHITDKKRIRRYDQRVRLSLMLQSYPFRSVPLDGRIRYTCALVICCMRFVSCYHTNTDIIYSRMFHESTYSILNYYGATKIYSNIFQT